MNVKTIQALSYLTATLLIAGVSSGHVYADSVDDTSDQRSQADILKVDMPESAINKIAEMQRLSRSMIDVSKDFAKWSVDNQDKALSESDRKALLDRFAYRRAGMSLEDLARSYEKVSEEVLSNY
ncbi:hypothetical protein J4N45_10245 [Vibrio sp. SCSIO 43140]|uniref:hypothetical protein n=1 Tax=Vibrio sp. SCSIO 43140 TaxID=2819100 RepID=UPI002074BB68|nr:hypothetical protein [Vibrio sp. SCSIO 43140]USD58909.1 hypothetical protein J4N45_10245 [Vibrio sp. SCSIO 43140]